MSNQSQIIDEERVLDPRHELISSRRVEGTAVFNNANERLGTIHSVMIEKRSGQVAYALMSFGGFLGVAGHVHPIPWDMLVYDLHRDGYVADLGRDQLLGAPQWDLGDADRPKDRSQDEEVYRYYGRRMPPWWGL